MRRVTVNREVTITFDGTEKEYVSFANYLASDGGQEIGLDSLDAGDATGFYAQMVCESEDGTWTATAPSGHMISGSYQEDISKWEGEWGS